MRNDRVIAAGLGLRPSCLYDGDALGRRDRAAARQCAAPGGRTLSRHAIWCCAAPTRACGCSIMSYEAARARPSARCRTDPAGRLPDADHGRLWQRQVRHRRPLPHRRPAGTRRALPGRDAGRLSRPALHRSIWSSMSLSDVRPTPPCRSIRAFRRFLGIGNATGLGMAPFLMTHPRAHRQLDGGARDRALAPRREWQDDLDAAEIRASCCRAPGGTWRSGESTMPARRHASPNWSAICEALARRSPRSFRRRTRSIAGAKAISVSRPRN